MRAEVFASLILSGLVFGILLVLGTSSGRRQELSLTVASWLWWFVACLLLAAVFCVFGAYSGWIVAFSFRVPSRELAGFLVLAAGLLASGLGGGIATLVDVRTNGAGRNWVAVNATLGMLIGLPIAWHLALPMFNAVALWD